MKIKYYKKDDILVLQLSKIPYDYAEMEGDCVVHFSKDRKPVRIEILNAKHFLQETSKINSQSIRQQALS